MADHTTAPGDCAPAGTKEEHERFKVGDRVALPCEIQSVGLSESAAGLEVIGYAVKIGRELRMVAPGGLVRLPEPSVPCAGGGSPDGPPPAESPAAGEVAWFKWAGGSRTSGDGRFVVGHTVAGGLTFTARDNWAGGEHAGPYSTEVAARRWCELRAAGAPLDWVGPAKQYGGGAFVLWSDDGKWHGTDIRLVHGHAVRLSPAFATPGLAREWCEVRAACEVVGTGLGATLRYRPPAETKAA